MAETPASHHFHGGEGVRCFHLQHRNVQFLRPADQAGPSVQPDTGEDQALGGTLSKAASWDVGAISAGDHAMCGLRGELHGGVDVFIAPIERVSTSRIEGARGNTGTRAPRRSTSSSPLTLRSKRMRGITPQHGSPSTVSIAGTTSAFIPSTSSGYRRARPRPAASPSWESGACSKGRHARRRQRWDQHHRAKALAQLGEAEPVKQAFTEAAGGFSRISIPSGLRPASCAAAG